eukprot:947121-Prorocentrum_minimum.AAC.2
MFPRRPKSGRRRLSAWGSASSASPLGSPPPPPRPPPAASGRTPVDRWIRSIALPGSSDRTDGAPWVVGSDRRRSLGRRIGLTALPGSSDRIDARTPLESSTFQTAESKCSRTT